MARMLAAMTTLNLNFQADWCIYSGSEDWSCLHSSNNTISSSYMRTFLMGGSIGYLRTSTRRQKQDNYRLIDMSDVSHEVFEGQSAGVESQHQLEHRPLKLMYGSLIICQKPLTQVCVVSILT